MKPFPHRYTVDTQSTGDGDVQLNSDTLPPLTYTTPTEFDGPGGRWSPETLLVGAVGSCFLLTFRGIARKSRLSWNRIECELMGTLDRVDGVTQFVAFELRARLELPPAGDAVEAQRVLERAERHCLIASSLKAPVHLVPAIVVQDASARTMTAWPTPA
jgi:organic hydroperoxide reductase OsmC/OhrA